MDNQIIIYWILLIFFISVSFYNFRIRKQCIYPVKITKPRAIIIIIIPLIFFSMAYYLDQNFNLWRRCLMATSASLLIISRLVGEGIHGKGIYYYRGRRILATLAKWEDIKDIEIDMNKSQLKKFTNTKYRTAIYPDQYYSSEDIDEINKFICNKKTL